MNRSRNTDCEHGRPSLRTGVFLTEEKRVPLRETVTAFTGRIRCIAQKAVEASGEYIRGKIPLLETAMQRRPLGMALGRLRGRLRG
ncbi:hypothetical protein TR75_01840 [Hydrogenibacillus schlegelii]|nr:hypothetical protein TR75_01840 [Hydrogenibacillus schlegelii]